MKRFLAAMIGLILALPASASDAGSRPFTRSLANDLVLYALMSSNAYADDDEKIYFPLEELGWKKVDLKGEPVPAQANSYRPKTFVGDFFSNLQFDIWEDMHSNRTVIAFKGTKERIDWVTGNLMIGISIPYKSAKKHVRAYMNTHPERTVMVTGHSLGGGLALSVSAWEGVDAIVFNTSPRIFDGARNMNKPAQRLAVFQEHDILQKIRRWYPKFLATIKPSDIVETRFDYAGRNTHRIDLLAQGLLSCSTDPHLRAVAGELKPSVPCYLPSSE
ncbi:MAG: DUF2974 domain-containing protein [Thauera sp.]|nr:DUF2974 domain-containing protein [Thauera sp.]